MDIGNLTAAEVFDLQRLWGDQPHIRAPMPGNPGILVALCGGVTLDDPSAVDSHGWCPACWVVAEYDVTQLLKLVRGDAAERIEKVAA